MNNFPRAVAAVAVLSGLAGVAIAQSRSGNVAQCADERLSFDVRIDACTTLIQAKPESSETLAEAFRNRGYLYATRGQFDRGIDDLNQAIKLRTDYAEAFFNRGVAYRLKGEFDRAIQDFDQATKLKTDYADALQNRGEAYADKGDYDRAIQDYDSAIKLQVGIALAFTANSRGYAKFYLGRFSEAAMDLQRYVDVFGGPGALFLHVAKKLGGQDDVKDFGERVAQLDPKGLSALIGRLFLGQATPGEVLAAAASGSPEAQRSQRCEAAFYLGEYALLRQETAEAVSRLQEARDSCPKSSPQYRAAATELKRLGK